jgi:hypothetical protein
MPGGLIEAIIACIIVGSAYDSGSFVKSGVGCGSDIWWNRGAGAAGAGGGGSGGRDDMEEGMGNDDGGGSLVPSGGSGNLRSGRDCWRWTEWFIDKLMRLIPPHAWRRSRKGGVPNMVILPPNGFALSGDTMSGGGKSKLGSGAVSSSILSSSSSSSSSSNFSSTSDSSVSGKYISNDGRIGGTDSGSASMVGWDGVTGEFKPW